MDSMTMNFEVQVKIRLVRMIQLEFIEDHNVCMKLNGNFVDLNESVKLEMELSESAPVALARA